MARIESRFIYGGTSDVCGGPNPNEDYFCFKVLEPETLLMVIADGMGGKPSGLQPAAIAAVKAVETVERLFSIDRDVFFQNPVMMLQEAVSVANHILGAFKMANEEQHAGFAAAMTCVLVYGEKFCFVHTGNCRINHIRIQPDGSNRITQITVDQTAAMEQLEDGVITWDEYYGHPDRFKLTSCLGWVNNPDFQTYEGKLKPNDMLLLTTDGVHYNIQQKYMAQIVLEAQDWQGATQGLVQGAKMEKAQDNATAVFFLCPKK